jgi:hypothetical protein
MSGYKPIPTGTRFHRWTIVSRGPNRSARAAQFWCRCDCGVERLVQASHLRQGLSTSCGCLTGGGRVPHHGHTVGRTTTPTYRAWVNMIRRCTDPNHDSYPNYGGRGVSVCPEWRHSFASFLSAMGDKPGPIYSLDRIDNDGDYEPGNCRWATRIQQRANRRDSKGASKR